MRALIKEELAAGFYNIDIDASTLVDLEKPTLAEQQELNTTLAADFTAFIRRHEPAGRHGINRRRDWRSGRPEFRRPRASRVHDRLHRAR